MASPSDSPDPSAPPPPDFSPVPPSPPSPRDSSPPPRPAPSANPIVDEIADEVDSTEPGSLAPFNTRLIAALIDSVIAAGLYILLLFILPGILSLVAWLVFFAYYVTRDSLPFLDGQSIGKKAMKLRAVTFDNQPLTGNWEKGLIRNGVLIIPFFAIIEIVVLLTREDKADRGIRLGDEWAKTKVIVVPPSLPPAA